jgi:hypothetical protein
MNFILRSLYPQDRNLQYPLLMGRGGGASGVQILLDIGAIVKRTISVLVAVEFPPQSLN